MRNRKLPIDSREAVFGIVWQIVLFAISLVVRLDCFVDMRLGHDEELIRLSGLSASNQRHEYENIPQILNHRLRLDGEELIPSVDPLHVNAELPAMRTDYHQINNRVVPERKGNLIAALA
jgi:hypothetical protein